MRIAHEAQNTAEFSTKAQQKSNEHKPYDYKQLSST